jgi:protein-tyrosine kinase
MPRIDEALARARNARTDEWPPLVGQPADEVAPLFPPEPGAEVRPEPPAAAPRSSEPASAPDTTLLPSSADMATLPLAEKLCPTTADATSVEQYRRLAARLYLLQSEKRTSIVMVTSAMPGEGKTLTAANLALTLSESYRRKVLLVDADLRRPSMHQVFNVPNLAGLNEGLRAQTERKIPLLELTSYLTLLPAGRPEADPMSVLSSDRMRRVLEEAGAKFEWVIIDTPPVGLLTDAHLLTSVVDTVLLVVEAARTPLAALRTAIQAIGRERILGVVLNRAEDALPAGKYMYYEQPARG